MMVRKNLTARFIESIPPPSSGRSSYWDAGIPAFGLRVTPTGRKSWIVLYRHQRRLRRLTLGTYPTMSLTQAREQAKDALYAAAKGKDPAAEKTAARAAETFAQLAEDYIVLHAKPNKRSWKEDRRALDRDLLPRFRHRKAGDIRRREVIALLDAINARGAPVKANRTCEIMRSIFNWAIAKERLSSNPCSGIRPFEETPRDRVLGDEEIRAVWAALDSRPPTTAARFRLQLLTAQRPGEIRQMRSQDIDLENGWWTISAALSKNGISHRVPLTALALEIVRTRLAAIGESGWLFPSPTAAGPVRSNTKPTAAICRAAKVKFTPHDLRRTAASYMGSIGVDRFVIRRVLNHSDKDMTAVYDRHSYDAEKRRALEAWSARLDMILTGTEPESDKVVPLHASRERSA